MLYIILDNDWTQIFPQLLFKNSCQDTSAKFVDKFSIVGGTMGLLTGFSIISGIEIIYFVIKFLFGNLRRTISSENWGRKMSRKKKIFWIFIYNTFVISMWIKSFPNVQLQIVTFMIPNISKGRHPKKNCRFVKIASFTLPPSPP